MAGSSDVELFRVFRRKTSNKEKAIELLSQYNPSRIKNLVDITKKHKSLLQRACILGWIDVYNSLITEYKCDPHHVDDKGETVLHTACQYGRLDLVRSLVSKPWSMDPLMKNKNGATPLDYSDKYSDVRMYLDSILDIPQDMSKPECSESTNSFSKEDLFKCFRRKTSNKKEAIDRIRGYNSETPLKDLVDTKDHHCKSLLQWASIRKWSDVCEMLINDHQCDPFYEDADKWTVLHNVCRNGHFDLVRYFVSKPFEMDPLKKNKDGTTPLDFSRQHGYTDITEYLENIIRSSSSILNNMPSLHDAFNCFRTKSADWDDIGRALYSVSGNDTSNIRKELRRNVALSNYDRLEAILNIWLEQGGYSSTWGQLVEALKEDYLDVVNNIEEFLELPLSKAIKEDVPNEATELGYTSTQRVEPDPEVDKTANADYRPFLEEAAKSGTVKSKITSIGIFGASGAGKTSLLRLLQGEEPVYEHNSTPVARPLRGIWLVSQGDKKWIEGSSDTLHKAIANSIKQAMKKDEGSSSAQCKGTYDESPQTKKRKMETDSSLPTSPSSSPAASSQAVLDLPATKLVATFLESRQDQTIEGFHFLNVTDSGGQAPFIDIAPSLFPYNLLNLVVFKLTKPLKSEITFNYSIKGKLVSSKKRKITTEQLITAIFSSKSKIHKPEMKGLDYSESFERPQFMTFGTYYDEYKKNENNMEKLKVKNEILKDDLRDFEENLIPNGDEIIFPLNTLSRDKETEEMAEKIRELASDYHAEVEVPVKWYLFQIAIEELKLKNEAIIPFSIFSDIGKKHNMDEEVTKHALSYLHDLNICLFYPEILPQVVFTSPQYLFEKISEIVAVSLNERQEKSLLDAKTRNKLIKEGIFTKSLLAKLHIEFLDGLFSADDFLKLMYHLHIITPLVDDTMPGTYFMPCLLESPPDNDPINNLENLEIQCIEPLLLTWNNTVPNGLFVFLTSWLIHSSRLKLNTKQKQYRSKITLDCKSLACQIIIFEYPAFIGLANVNTCGETAIIEKSSILFKMILNGIDSIVKDCKWYRAVAFPEIAYLCKIVECDLKNLHLCYTDVERKYLSCSEDSSLRMKQTPAHLVWFEQKGSTKNILQKLPSHEEICSLMRDKSSQWYQIGNVLCVPFDKREEFRTDPNRNNDSRLEAVVNLWLQNGGDTSTWDQLIKKLQELGLNDIVSKIATFLAINE